MIIYIIRCLFCSGILLLAYQLLLANERMYRFNRFYLLASLILSFTLPFIQWQWQAGSTPATTALQFQQLLPSVPTPSPIAIYTHPTAVQQQSSNHLSYLLLCIYIVITLALLIRFTVNLYHLYRKIIRCERVIVAGHQLLLTNTNMMPHSFLRWIFISRVDYESRQIEPEIISHEKAHGRQLHTLDILLAELLQAIGWFNPLIPFYRRALQLNHEFLADEHVLQNYHNTPAYQHLLLSRATQSNSTSLHSHFNYVTIKKRFIMMTKSTSTTRMLVKQLALAPVLGITLLLSSNSTIAQSTPPVPKTTVTSSKNEADAPADVIEEYHTILTRYGTATTPKGFTYQRTDFNETDRARLLALYLQMSREQQRTQPVIFRPYPKPANKQSPDEKQYNSWKSPSSYGVWIDGKKVANSELNRYKASDFDQFNVSRLAKNALHYNEYRCQVDLMTKAYYADYRKNALEKQNDYIVLRSMVKK